MSMFYLTLQPLAVRELLHKIEIARDDQTTRITADELTKLEAKLLEAGERGARIDGKSFSDQAWRFVLEELTNARDIALDNLDWESDAAEKRVFQRIVSQCKDAMTQLELYGVRPIGSSEEI